MLRFLFCIANRVLDPLEDVDEHEVAEASLLDPSITNAEYGQIKDPLEESCDWDKLLEGGGLVQLKRLKAHRL